MTTAVAITPEEIQLIGELAFIYGLCGCLAAFIFYDVLYFIATQSFQFIDKKFGTQLSNRLKEIKGKELE